jgi:hypothetical protein
MEQERRRVGPAQRAIEGERRQRERHRIALREHDLEDVAGRDVVLRALDHVHELGGRRVGYGLGQGQVGAGHRRGVRERLVERLHHGAEALHGMLVGGLRVDPGLGPDGRHDDHLVLHGVEHDHNGRAHEHAVGDAEGVGPNVRKVLHEAHRVIAHVADDAGRDRRQLGRQVDAGGRQQLAQGFQRGPRLGLESMRMCLRAPVDLGAAAEHAPYNVGGDADDRVAPPHGPALDGLQEAAQWAAVAELQHGRNRRLEIGHEARPEDLRMALAVARRERAAHRLDFEIPGCDVELRHAHMQPERAALSSQYPGFDRPADPAPASARLR